MHSAHLIDIISSLPQTPGIYKYFDQHNELMYIGKAKNLKKRVSSYFTKSHDNRKTEIMVSKIADIQFMLVDSEIDALLLENALIKKHQPRFNINLKDDKTYPYLCIKNEAFPRIFPTRKPIKDGSEYFGPYASIGMMRTIMEVIKSLYPIRTCNYVLSDSNIASHKFKACLEYQIGNCMAPCIGKQTEDAYQENITAIKSILKGNIGPVKQKLKEDMMRMAADLKFEEAAICKRKLEILDSYQSKSTIVSSQIDHVDVFSITSDDKFAFVNYLKVLKGIIVQTQTFELKKKMAEDEVELLSYAIGEVRETYRSNAPEIILPFAVDIESNELTFTIPKAGDKKKLLDLSLKNAIYYRKEKLAQYDQLNPELKTERILSRIQNDLRLTTLPRWIECFDNSNIQGTHPVSACVVFKDAKPSKKEYRHFNVKSVVGPNDFDTMREVVYRRYSRLLSEGNALPDLIVIDGGKGQLHAATDSLKKLNLYGKIPVVGIAKRLEELYFPEDELPLYIDKKSETLKIIQHIRDEAHRFGITHHRNRRSKTATRSELLEIPGIGKQTMEKLLVIFKSVKQIREASADELSAVIGMSKTQMLKKYFENLKD